MLDRHVIVREFLGFVAGLHQHAAGPAAELRLHVGGTGEAWERRHRFGGALRKRLDLDPGAREQRGDDALILFEERGEQMLGFHARIPFAQGPAKGVVQGLADALGHLFGVHSNPI